MAVKTRCNENKRSGRKHKGYILQKQLKHSEGRARGMASTRRRGPFSVCSDRQYWSSPRVPGESDFPILWSRYGRPHSQFQTSAISFRRNPRRWVQEVRDLFAVKQAKSNGETIGRTKEVEYISRSNNLSWPPTIVRDRTMPRYKWSTCRRWRGAVAGLPLTCSASSLLALLRHSLPPSYPPSESILYRLSKPGNETQSSL